MELITASTPATAGPTGLPAPHPRAAEVEAAEVAAAEVEAVVAAARTAAGRVAPVWPLDRFVAVNPYLGVTDRPWAQAAELLATVAGIRSTLPAAAYLEAIHAGDVTVADVAAGLADIGHREAADPHGFLRRIRRDAAAEDTAWAPRVATVADVAAAVTGRDWPRLRTDRVSSWAAAHFDQGQALWRPAERGTPPFAAWKEEAVHDRTPEILGLAGFRRTMALLPDTPEAAIHAVLGELGVPDDGRALYLHALLARLGGWVAHTARLAFEASRRGDHDDSAVDLAAVLLGWELGVLRGVRSPAVQAAWEDARRQLRDLGGQPPVRDAVADRLALQAALDHAAQRRLVTRLTPRLEAAARPGRAARPRLQAVFCIDVRSEVIRRHLEAAGGDAVETLGFAGFFGLPVRHRPLAHEVVDAHCPVLLEPQHTVVEQLGNPAATATEVARRTHRHGVARAWKAFKMGAVSCFSFVGPVGLLYLPKLVSDATAGGRRSAGGRHRGGPTRAGSAPSTGWPAAATHLGAGAAIPLAERVRLAEGALRGMSLTEGLAPVVLLVGHGASTTNNPYANALHCGACGGQRGDVSARLAAAILNDPEVRAGLAAAGIAVPPDTWFVAALHDTTTDDVTVLDAAAVPASHHAALDEVRRWLDAAGAGARRERAATLSGADPATADHQVRARARDWAQVRPEWGLAGCRAFVAAPRNRTRGLDLAGEVFLHSYDWEADDGFGVLESILTAPVVVASWITLQYYGSTVDNDHFGAGDKTLHNVVGRLGVLEGHAGDLRTGLPWQSVHDGTRLRHLPLRLDVVVEAPRHAVDGVLAGHPEVAELVDHGWIRLLAIADGGIHRRHPEGRWERCAGVALDDHLGAGADDGAAGAATAA